MVQTFVTVKAPGRICLMGEHQDYLGLNVISGAFDRYIVAEAYPRYGNDHATDSQFNIILENLGRSRWISASSPSPCAFSRDYLQSGVNIMLQSGFKFSKSYDIKIHGNIPIGKGVSSSSALCTAWIALLAAIADDSRRLPPGDIATYAFRTEVEYFSEPGGMQDHIASAYGGLMYMDFSGGRQIHPEIESLYYPPGVFLLADTGTTKPTLKTIQSVRTSVEKTSRLLRQQHHITSSLRSVEIKDIPPSIRHDDSTAPYLGTLINRNLVSYTRNLLKQNQFSSLLAYVLGRLLNTHHTVLKSCLKTSVSHIDDLCTRACSAGAWGAKIIGSGGGGCFLIYSGEDRVNHIKASLSPYLKEIYTIDFASGVTVTFE